MILNYYAFVNNRPPVPQSEDGSAGEATAPQVRKTSKNSEIVNWRRERDLNPRYVYTYTTFPR